MAKDPAFLFYPNDWLGGTMGMSFDLQGAYLTLLIFQFNKGEFSEIQAINTITKTRWDELKNKFKTDGNLYWNERLKDEHDKRKNYSKSRKNNRLKGVTYVNHMENENEIRIEDKDLIELYGEKMIEDFLRYWNEPNGKGKRRWQFQPTWSLKSRLVTWNNRSKNFKPKETGSVQQKVSAHEEVKNRILNKAS